MEELVEIPKYVRYDFLITLLGLVYTSAAWYFSIVKGISSNETNILFLIGIPLVIWGIGEMYNNYSEERDLRQLQIIVEKKKTFDELVEHKIMDKTKNKFFVGSLKKEIGELVKKKKIKKIKKKKIKKIKKKRIKKKGSWEVNYKPS